jgi:hypothetical protein
MKVRSIFSQVLKLFSRGEFEKAVKEHMAERHARGFTSWGQFLAMLFCQLGRAAFLARDLWRPAVLRRTVEASGGCPWRRRSPPPLPQSERAAAAEAGSKSRGAALCQPSR